MQDLIDDLISRFEMCVGIFGHSISPFLSFDIYKKKKKNNNEAKMSSNSKYAKRLF